jgi:hypothetical protein
MKNLYENLCYAVGLMLVGSTFANEHPVYSDTKAELQVPTVLVAGKPGVYEVISLNVYGLQSDVYEYIVNDKFSGSFSLTTDNSIH